MAQIKKLRKKTVPTSDINYKSQIITCTSDQPAINWGSHNPFLEFRNLLE